ncbi:MAG: hypothetical protein K8R60_17795 [Burkholderiales bacterium]|nr:hypothetical protein [Burkholderiales bacterium]
METSKKQLNPPASPWHGEALEFEITGFDEARRVLDDESMTQFEVVPSSSPEQWKRVRRPKLPTDRALSGQAIDWLISLPPSLRPEKLGAQFPRIANALAEVWNDPDECQAALDRLLDEQRKGRSGFPAKVHDELVSLRDWVAGLRGWNEPF